MSKTLKISENITFQSIGNNIYILNVNNGEYYELSESASLIWNEIIKEKNSDNVKTKIKSLYIDADEIENDIDDVINNLLDLGLIEHN
tara:strand:+ start:357 stop:620 length:264 start_codon:yes stop_codon:yes gene_type:complete